MKEEKEKYQEQLGDLEEIWIGIKELFSDFSADFTKIISEAQVSLEDLNLSFDFVAIEGSIKEETFNEIFRGLPNRPEMIFHFNTNETVIEVPEMHLVLIGTFTIEETSVLTLDIKEGSFYEMPLETSAIRELFKEGYLKIDFKNLLKDMFVIDLSLESVETTKGYLKFKITID